VKSKIIVNYSVKFSQINLPLLLLTIYNSLNTLSYFISTFQIAWLQIKLRELISNSESKIINQLLVINQTNKGKR